MQVRFLGHAGCLLQDRGVTLAIDPWLTGNPLAVDDPADIKADYILLTHAHDDHMGDTIEIAKANDALIITTFEVANLCQEQGARAHPMHVGGRRDFDFGSVRLTPATHGSGVPGGLASGFLVELFDTTVYHAGDTGIFGDMELLADMVDIDLALLPIGGNFTMDIDDAVVATAMLQPRIVIPIHYNTFPVIEADPGEFREAVEDDLDTEVVILAPGETFSL